MTTSNHAGQVKQELTGLEVYFRVLRQDNRNMLLGGHDDFQSEDIFHLKWIY